MSHIFDALQRSAAERRGSAAQAISITELLRDAERDAVGRGTAVVDEPQNEPKATAEIPRAQGPEETRPQGAAAISATDAAMGESGQFQALKLVKPPHERLVCLTAKESLAAEKFRFLGVRLRQLQQSRRLKKVLVTSTMPQEGKSVVAANLACVLAQRSQQKTLLVEGDLRQPSLPRLFELPRLAGMCECLRGDCALNGSIHHLDGHNLWILPAGTTPRNPLELMQSGRLSALMERCTDWFDWIVIDSPPVLPLADTSIWMRLVDGILLVVRPGTTEKEQLQKGLETIESAKLLGALLNSSANTARNNYYLQYLEPSPKQARTTRHS